MGDSRIGFVLLDVDRRAKEVARMAVAMNTLRPSRPTAIPPQRTYELGTKRFTTSGVVEALAVASPVTRYFGGIPFLDLSEPSEPSSSLSNPIQLGGWRVYCLSLSSSNPRHYHYSVIRHVRLLAEAISIFDSTRDHVLSPMSIRRYRSTQ